MSENKALELLKKIKVQLGMNDAPAAPAPMAAPGAPAPAASDNTNDDAVVNQWNVEGGQPVFINNSDDGIAGIDKGDAAWMDEAMTQPYPDGSYKVAGTDFGFTVSKGSVTDVNDPDGKGAGDPVPDEDDMDMMKTPQQMMAALQKFADPAQPAQAPDMQKMAVILKACFEYCFGWQIQQQEQQATVNTAIEAYKSSFSKVSPLEKEVTELKKENEKFKSAIPQILSLVEEIANTPVADPLPGQQSFKADDKENRSIKLEAIANNLKDLRKKTA